VLSNAPAEFNVVVVVVGRDRKDRLIGVSSVQNAIIGVKHAASNAKDTDGLM